MSSLGPEKDPVADRNHPDFVAVYEYMDDESDTTFNAPFPVAVFGIHQEFLGVGQVVGSIDDVPVIEVQDSSDGKLYYVMGYESWWTCPVPDEMIDLIAAGTIKTKSVSAYRQAQDNYWKAAEMADSSFLEDTGIDPDSL